MCPENRRLVKGGDRKTAELVLEQPSEGRDPGRSGRILTVTGDAVGMRQQIRDRTEISGKQSGTTEE